MTQGKDYLTDKINAIIRERKGMAHATAFVKKPMIFLSLPRERKLDWNAATNMHAAARQKTKGVRFIEAVVLRCDASPNFVGRTVIIDYILHPDAVVDYNEVVHRPILDHEGAK